MSSPRRLSPRRGLNRRGLSFVEFIGCMLALGSGVAIGSVYLGVDMKTLFVGILERADLVDPGFFGTKAVAQQTTPAPEAAPLAPAALAPTEVAASTVAETPDQPAEPVAAADEPATGESPTEATAESPSESIEAPLEAAAPSEPDVELTDAERLAATLNYWQGLTAAITAEKQHRNAAPADIENWQLFDYLTLRREGHLAAVEAIEKLDERGVDDRLLWHGRQVLSWHQAGAKLYGRAVDLLTDAPTDQLTGPFAQSWQSSATQHRMEERLVREKHLSVAGYLDHAFKDQAPFKPAF